MRTRTLFLSLLSSGMILTSCGEEKNSKTITTPDISFQKEGEAFISTKEGDTLARLDIEIADNDYERETGLMYRDQMKDTQAMLFIFEDEAPRGFYMKNTTIALDIVFLNRSAEIVRIVPETQPNSLETISSQVPSQYVLEIRSGLAQKWDIEPGDRLHWIPLDH